MKKTMFILSFVLFFSLDANACPYQKMAEVDTQLFSNKGINTQTFAQVSELRSKGEKQLQIGELDNAEKIFDRALAILSNK